MTWDQVWKGLERRPSGYHNVSTINMNDGTRDEFYFNSDGFRMEEAFVVRSEDLWIVTFGVWTSSMEARRSDVPIYFSGDNGSIGGVPYSYKPFAIVICFKNK